MRRTQTSEAFRALRVGSALLLCGGLAVVLLALGQGAAAGGVIVGCAFYALNAFLLFETGRALLEGGQAVRFRVGVSAVGRLLLLGVLLAGVFALLGRSTGIGACGGLLISQLNVQLPVRRTGVVT